MSFDAFCRRICVVAGVLIAASISGCGKHSDRLAVDGKVTLNGSPLDQGAMRFSSVGGDKAFASGAMIKDGEYHIPEAKGLAPGTYRVEISSPDTKAPLVVARTAPGEPPGPPTAPERIPADYNLNSKKTVDVAEGKDNQFDFDIVSGRGK